MSISNLATGLRPGVCTSTTRPTSPYTGQLVYETDTGYLRVWDGANWDYISKSQDDTTNLPISGIGAAWTSWTPTVTQSGSVTVTNTASRYNQIQKLVYATSYLTVTGSGTGGNNVIVSIPVTAQSNGNAMVGFGWIYDASATTIYNCTVTLENTTTAKFWYSPNTTGGAFGTNPNVALANTDQIRFTLIYEAA